MKGTEKQKCLQFCVVVWTWWKGSLHDRYFVIPQFWFQSTVKITRIYQYFKYSKFLFWMNSTRSPRSLKSNFKIYEPPHPSILSYFSLRANTYWTILQQNLKTSTKYFLPLQPPRPPQTSGATSPGSAHLSARCWPPGSSSLRFPPAADAADASRRTDGMSAILGYPEEAKDKHLALQRAGIMKSYVLILLNANFNVEYCLLYQVKPKVWHSGSTN